MKRRAFPRRKKQDTRRFRRTGRYTSRQPTRETEDSNDNRYNKTAQTQKVSIDRQIDGIKREIELMNLSDEIKITALGILDGLRYPDQEYEDVSIIERARSIVGSVSNTISTNDYNDEVRKAYEHLLESSSDIHFVVDPDSTNILFVNKQVERILGYEASKLIFNPFSTIVSTQMREAIREQKHSDKFKSSFYLVKHINGSLVQVSINVTKVPWQHGEAVLITLQDQTVKLKNKQLEKKVGELEPKTKISDEAAKLAHDFKNIITVVLGNLDCIESNALLDSKTREDLLNIRRAILRGKNLASDALTFSKKPRIRRKKTSITAILKSIVKAMDPGERSLVQTNLSEEHIASVDPNKIANVIQNLLINACHAVEKNGIVNVEVEEVELEDNNYLCIIIEDNGTGIPADMVKKIFEPYFTTKPPGSGTGLGLAIAKDTIELHGGRISVESKTGDSSYTKFRVYLPINGKKQKNTGRSEKFKTVEIMKGNQIIVVDDEDTLRNLNKKFADDITLKCDLAQNSEECMEHVEKANYGAVVLLDQNLGDGINGTDLAKEIKKMRPDITIIIYSGYQIDPVIRALLNDKIIYRYIEKPYCLGELKDILKEIFLKGKGFSG